MDISLYYQILGMGVLYEKGGKRGKRWRIGERKRLRDEIVFWQSILEDVSKEKNGVRCHEELFAVLGGLCRKYRFPNYERVLVKKEELINCSDIFVRDNEEEGRLREFMERLLQDAGNRLEQRNGKEGKEAFYRILNVLHNLPKVMYGSNRLNPAAHSIPYSAAVKYAKGCMDEKMKKKYEKYLV